MWTSAKQITPRGQRWLRTSRSARVLHLFFGTCSLVNERAEVISLVTPSTGMGPFTLLLDGDFTAGLDAGQAVSINNAQQTVTVGSLTVEFGDAAVWQPGPDWKRLRHADTSGWPSPAELPPDIDGYLQRAISGIAADDLPAFRVAVEGLAGRGGGLTPAGDDVLVGMFYALWVWRPRRGWPAMVEETVIPRTTNLSANFIRAAAAGEAVRQWHDLASGDPWAVDRLLATGHTSGADAWAGFMGAWSVMS